MKYKLGQLGTVYSGGTPSTKNAEFWDGDIAWITPKDLAGYSKKKISKGERNITDAGLSGSSANLIPAGSVLMSSRAPIGYVAIANNELSTNQGFKSINCDERICLNEYIYYWIKSNIEYIKSKANGSTFKEISGSSFKNLDVDVPDLETQKKIVRILSALDQKIELNNKQSNTLETVAFTIYDDFIKNLNEGEFKKVAIGRVADCKLGGTPSRAKPEYWNGDINWINSGSINSLRITEPSELITEEGFRHTSTYMLPQGTTVLAITGATLGQVSRMEIEGCANQSVIGILGNGVISDEYIYLTTMKNIQTIINRQTGGAQQHINKNDIKEFVIILPNQQLMSSFTNKVKPIFEKIAENKFENKTLSSLRDNILPKLMSGDVSLDKVTNGQ